MVCLQIQQAWCGGSVLDELRDDVPDYVLVKPESRWGN
jgi:hypothetical protein